MAGKMADNRVEEGEEVDNPNSTISNAGHPLLNLVVMTKIFEGVTLPELRTLRLVCKDWLSVSLPIWRRTVQINIHEESSNNQLLQWKSLGKQLDLAVEQPFRNFRLDTPQFLSDISRPHRRPLSIIDPVEFEATYRNMGKFWTDYGHWIHKLELKEVYMTDVEAFKKAIFEQTPNLQELTVDRINTRATNSRDPLPAQANSDENEGVVHVQPNLNLKVFSLKNESEFPVGWRFLFNRFPNIQKLKLPEPDNSLDEFVDCVEEMLRNPARRPNLPITDLRLEDFAVGAVKRLLRMPRLKLKVLHLTLDRTAAEDLDVIQTAMLLHRKDLNELHLRNSFESKDFWGYVKGPCVALTELEMKGHALTFSFDFLNKLPNLKVLRVEQEDEERMLAATNWAALERMPNLQEFYFILTGPVPDVILSEEILDRFAELMPNLDSFTGKLDNLTLRVVCRNWRKLKKLVVLSCWFLDCVDPADLPLGDVVDIDDVGITGIVPGSDERVPCVADLQELRHVTLEHVTLIGNASVFDGFLKLPRLSSLDICDTNKIDMDGHEALRRRLEGGLTISDMYQCL